MISIAFANIAGGRLVGPDGYDDADRTADFGHALAGLRPDVLIVTELDPDGDQLERLAAAAMPGRAGLLRAARVLGLAHSRRGAAGSGDRVGVPVDRAGADRPAGPVDRLPALADR
ncbi:hypothetical protein [Kribbella sp. NPDC050459]|uniref:hypothetical protein n=1 Tax=Kribbella sp. NPDC050459 TaxID=3155785 RepID=UPI0033E8E596